MQKTDKYSFNEIFLPCIIEHGLLRVLSYTRRQIFLMKICLSTYHVKNWNHHKQICIRYSRHDVRFLYFDLPRIKKNSDVIKLKSKKPFKKNINLNKCMVIFSFQLMRSKFTSHCSWMTKRDRMHSPTQTRRNILYQHN